MQNITQENPPIVLKLQSLIDNRNRDRRRPMLTVKDKEETKAVKPSLRYSLLFTL